MEKETIITSAYAVVHPWTMVVEGLGGILGVNWGIFWNELGRMRDFGVNWGKKRFFGVLWRDF